MVNPTTGPQWQPDQVKALILGEREKGTNWTDIEALLNKKGLLTITGKKWTTGSACNCALRNGWISRIKNTSAGPSGSIGVKSTRRRRRSVNGHAPAAPVSDEEVEEIFTSNLNTKLKLKVIRLLSIYG